MSDDISIAAPEGGVEAVSTAEPAPVDMTGAERLDAKLNALSEEIAAGNASEDTPTKEPEEEALDGENTPDHDAEDSEEDLLDELLAEDGEAEAKPKLEIDFAGTKFEYKEGEMSSEMAERVQETIKGFEGAQTRKSQELAEMRKTVEEAQASVDRIQGLDGQALQLFTNGQQLKQEIARIEQMDLQALRQSNPDQARFLSDDLSTYKAQLAQVTNEVDRLETASSEARKVEMDRVMSEGEKEVLKLDPDFMKSETEVIEYVTKEFGMTEEQAKTWRLNPATAVMAKQAMLYGKLQERIKAKKSAKIPKPTPTKPVKGKGAAAKTDFSRMSASERKAYLGLPG